MKKNAISAKDFKFGTYGAVDIKPCRARTKLLKWCNSKNPEPINLIIEAEFDGGVQSNFDGVGQEFTITLNKVTVK